MVLDRVKQQFVIIIVLSLKGLCFDMVEASQ